MEREGVWPDPLVTEVVPLVTFYPAEAGHQGYFRRNERQPYCQVVIAPKLAKFRAHHLGATPGLADWATASPSL